MTPPEHTSASITLPPRGSSLTPPCKRTNILPFPAGRVFPSARDSTCSECTALRCLPRSDASPACRPTPRPCRLSACRHPEAAPRSPGRRWPQAGVLPPGRHGLPRSLSSRAACGAGAPPPVRAQSGQLPDSRTQAWLSFLPLRASHKNKPTSKNSAKSKGGPSAAAADQLAVP